MYETVNGRPEMAASEAVLNLLLTVSGLGAEGGAAAVAIAEGAFVRARYQAQPTQSIGVSREIPELIYYTYVWDGEWEARNGRLGGRFKPSTHRLWAGKAKKRILRDK
jgi:hypothetical protein